MKTLPVVSVCALLAAGVLPCAEAVGAPSRTARNDLMQALKRVRQLREEGKYKEALPLALPLPVDAEEFGADALEMGLAQGELASVYHALGQCSKAEPLFRESLRIYEKRLGQDHPVVAAAVGNLAACYQDLGEYARAEILFRRSLKSWQETAPDQPAVAAALSNLASLYQDMGQYDEARALFQQSLEGYEKASTRNPQAFASTLKNLASLYLDLGDHARAEPLLKRSLEVWQQVRPEDHPAVAAVLGSLAELYAQTGQPAKAEPLFERSLRLYKMTLTADHPAVAQCLHDQARLYHAQGKFATAGPLFERGLKIREARLGKDHPAVAQSLIGLASLAEADGRTAAAAELFDRARRVSRRHVTRILPALSSAQQAHFLRHVDQAAWHRALSLGLRDADTEELTALSASWLLNGKAVAHHTAAQSVLLARDSRDPAVRHLANKLRDVRQRLARLTLTVPREGQERDRLSELAKLATEEAQLAKDLGQAGDRSQDPEPWVEMGRLRERLPADAVFLDFARFRTFDFKERPGQPPEHYAVWVTPKKGPVRLIDLGPAKAIDDDLVRVRRGLTTSEEKKDEVKAEAALRESLAALSKRVLWPLLPHIGKTPRWIVSPDGNLWLAPWAALLLADGKYAVEKHAISCVVSGRDLLAAAWPAAKATRPLVLANPKFDLPLAEAGSQTQALLREHNLDATLLLAGRKARGQLVRPELTADIRVEFHADDTFVLRWDEKGEIIQKGHWSLEGDRLVVETSERLYRGQLDGQTMTGQRWAKSSKDADTDWKLELARTPDPLLVRQDAVGLVGGLNRAGPLPYTATEAQEITPALRHYTGTAPRVLTEKQALAPLVQGARHPRVLVLSTHGFFLPEPEPEAEEKKPAPVNPLLRCGLLFAGCNNATQARTGEDTGVLTGLQVVGCDLRGCELVVLSACETGLGDVRNGEGVAGLRQAFQLAGAENVVATLWQVPDQQSAQLMIRFFDNLAQKQSKADALRNAQLALIKARRDKNAAAHPFFWAAYTLTGS